MIYNSTHSNYIVPCAVPNFTRKKIKVQKTKTDQNTKLYRIFQKVATTNKQLEIVFKKIEFNSETFGFNID